MKNRTYYLPQPVDKKMAELCGWTKDNQSQFSPYFFANLRGLYDTAHPNANLEVYDAQNALDTLIQFKEDLRKKRREDIQWAQNNTSKAYERLKEAYTVKEEDARVDFLFQGLVQIIEGLAKSNPSFTRKELIQGINRNGKYYGGQRYLFDALYDKLFRDYSYYTAIANGDTASTALYPGVTKEIAKHRAEAYEKIFQNWGLLTQRVRLKMKDMEGLKMMPKYDASISVNEGELAYNDMTELYDPETNTLEHWQEHVDEKSSIEDVDQDVKRILHLIPVTYVDPVTGEYKIQYDDLGSPQLMSFTEVYQKLKDMLGPVYDELGAIGMLLDYKEEAPWVRHLVKILESNPIYRSKFTVAFMLNRQEYSDVKVTQKGNQVSYRFRLLNQMRNRIQQALILRAGKGVSVSTHSIYKNKYTTDEKGNKVFQYTVIDWDNLIYIREHILKALVPPTPNFQKLIAKNISDMSEFKYDDDTPLDVTDPHTPNAFYFSHTTKTQRAKFVQGVSNALGIDMTKEEAFAILRDRNLQRQYIKYIFDIVHYGLDTFLSDAYATDAQWKGKDLDKMPEVIYVDPNGSELGNLVQGDYNRYSTGMRRYNEIINKMTLTLSRVRSEQQGERKIFRRNRKGQIVALYSDVKPNYMGDVFEHISTFFIKKGNKVGLKMYLEKNYLCSPLFAEKREDGSYYIYNIWLRKLWDIANSNAPLDSVANMRLFQYNRNLGTDKEDFEQLSLRQNAIDMIVSYYAPYMQTKNDNTAWYPIFVLGDSNKSKYVRQERYTFKEIIDGFYDIFVQERRRMAMIKATNKYLDEKGIQETGRPYKHIDNVDKSIDKYTMLTFLNDPKYHVAEDASEDTVKEVIREYLADACDEFKEYLQSIGALDTVTISDDNGGFHKEYKYLQDIINKSGKKDRFTSNEDVMTRVINDFYLNYKFAMLEQLNMMTIDNCFYKNTKDEQKRYKEIHASGTRLNLLAKDYAAAVNPKTGRPPRISPTGHQKVLYFDDIAIDGEETQPEFMTVIEHLFGKDSDIYKKYKENTLTDGQAWRSFPSYRKICIMAGMWTEEQEKAYRYIMDVRAAYGKGEIPTEVLKELEKRAAIFQPLKPYFYGHEHIVLNDKGDHMLIPVQHKYAEVPIIPELLPKGSKLRDMGYYMEENDIDMVMSTKCVKVGAFGSTKIDHLEQYDNELTLTGDEAADNITRLNHALSLAYVHQIPLANYRIQSMPPNHVHRANKKGTQFIKLIMRGAIQRARNPITGRYEVQERYDADGHNIYEKYVDYNKVLLNKSTGPVTMDSENIVALYNALLMANYAADMQTFINTINSNEKLSELMTQITLSNSRYSFENLSSYALDDRGKLSIPLFDGALEKDTSSMILSLYKKLVNQQVMNGGAAVQASAMGIKDYSEDGGLKYVCEGDNVLYAEAEIPFDFTYRDSKGRTIALQFDDFCNNDGTLILDSDGTP